MLASGPRKAHRGTLGQAEAHFWGTPSVGGTWWVTEDAQLTWRLQGWGRARARRLVREACCQRPAWGSPRARHPGSYQATP